MASEHNWFYVGRDGQQQGPVPGDEIVRLLQSGELQERSLLWREGMPEWAALSGQRQALGLPDASVEAPPAAAAQPAPRDAYTPPSASLRDEGEEPVAGEVVPAGFLRRWAALFVDQIIVSVAYYALFIVLMLIGIGAASAGLGSDRYETAMLGFYMLVYPTYFVIACAYYVLFEASATQATPGKLLLSIKVCDQQGRRLGRSHALGRWMAAALSYITLFIGFLMAAFTERKLALHDIVAGTQVVDRWAYTGFPERQTRQLHGCVIALLVFMAAMMLIALLGVLAAIAIPAYQDYTTRARGMASLEAAPLQGPAATGLPIALQARIEWPGR